MNGAGVGFTQSLGLFNVCTVAILAQAELPLYQHKEAGPMWAFCPSRKRRRCVGSNKGADKGAVECAAHVDVNADGDADYSPSEGSDYWHLECAEVDVNAGPIENEEVGQSTHLQPVPRGENEEVGADGRMFTVLRGKEGEVKGYSLKCQWHPDEDCVRDLKLGAINPMTVRECQLRLLKWEEAGRGLPEPARAAHKDLGSTQLLANFAS